MPQIFPTCSVHLLGKILPVPAISFHHASCKKQSKRSRFLSQLKKSILLRLWEERLNECVQQYVQHSVLVSKTEVIEAQWVVTLWQKKNASKVPTDLLHPLQLHGKNIKLLSKDIQFFR